jgi:hypothetical protein
MVKLVGLRLIAFLLVVPLWHCAGENTFSLQLTNPTARAMALLVESPCTVGGKSISLTEGTSCVLFGSGVVSVNIPTDYEGSPEKMACTITVTVLDQCAEPRSVLLRSTPRPTEFFNGTDKASFAFSATDFTDTFDDDGDGITNYAEFKTGGSPRGDQPGGACVPKTTPAACMNVVCGPVSDGCGGIIDCALCPSGQYCVQNQCVPL